MDSYEILSCPFCNYADKESYSLQLHVEVVHPETGISPFAVRETSEHSSNFPLPVEAIVDVPSQNAPASTPETWEYVHCPYGCGEKIASQELPVHADYHAAEAMAFEEADESSSIEVSSGFSDNQTALTDISTHFSTEIPTPPRSSQRKRPSSNSSRESRRARNSFKDFLLGKPRSPAQGSLPPVHTQLVSNGKARRLGRSELGPYAHERRMPAWLRTMLEESSKATISNKLMSDGTLMRVEAAANETPDLVPVLARLSEDDTSVQRALYCRPEVRHVAKLPREGGFCGYRNIQMMISYIRDAKSKGHENFPGRIPTILRLQDMIEQAWDMGFNVNGRIETGGVRGTRKYIGTPEAQAVFQSLGIPCEADAFSGTSDLSAYETLLLAVGDYFGQDQAKVSTKEKVSITNMPPLYFQHHGHSMTIVGIEVRTSGEFNLVVFDPMFQPAPAIRKLAHFVSTKHVNAHRAMKLHRRGEDYLSNYLLFEILRLT